MSHNNPDDRDIAYHGYDNYTAVSNGPEDDSPNWLHKLVPVQGPVAGVVGGGGPVRHIGGIE